MRYRILGVTQAADDQGTPLPIGGQRLRTLLTALALRPSRSTSPDTLIDEIWADDPPNDAPAALQALVGRLRRTLGRHTIASTPGGYRLEATEDDVDLYVFERLVHTGTKALTNGDPATAHRTLTEALALWHGPALADLPDRTAATRPEALRLEATRVRAAAALDLGRAPDVVPELTEVTAAHPLDEPLHALLIRALRDTGRPADALAAYETVRRTLADTLGTDPGGELKALHASLLRQREPQPQPPKPPTTPAPAQPPERTGNLRPRLTSFVGREPELEAIRSDLHRARLVTLTGPGGAGKTRLAEEAAAGLPQAWLVELAPLDHPEAVPGAVVSALRLRETVLLTNELATPQADPVALLIEYCAPRSQLLILDNCEHVIDAAAALAETLLTHCPGLTILATSREPLAIPGESVRPVEPLAPEQAHRLFAERAKAVRPDADAVLADTEAVAEICRRLDGLPLAIELAAARLRLLTPRQIADRLDDRFRLLTSGSRTVLPRQQTLRAVVDWSWDLLDERERTVLCEASVFAGGWDLAAAEAVCTGPAADLVGALVDKSLVVAAPCGPDGSGGMRYRMLETIHEYATERAAEAPGLRATAERRHRAWVRALVEEAEPRLRSADQLPWISRLETELDNIRAALDRSVRAGDEPEAGAIVLAIGWFWWLRNHRQEAVSWVRLVLRLGVALDTLSAPTPPAPSTSMDSPVGLDSSTDPDPPRVSGGSSGSGSRSGFGGSSGSGSRSASGGSSGSGSRSGFGGSAASGPRSASGCSAASGPRSGSGSSAATTPCSGSGSSAAPDPSAAPAPDHSGTRGTRGTPGTGATSATSGTHDTRTTPATSGTPATWRTSGTPATSGTPNTDWGARAPGAPSAGGTGTDLAVLVESADPVGAFLSVPDGEAGHPLRELRMDLRMLDLFLTSESTTEHLAADPRAPEYIARVRAAYEPGGPQAARLPGIVWPLTAYYLGGPADVGPDMAAAVANCRVYGGDWEIGVSLMYRTHVTVDSPGNLRGVDEDLAELRMLSRRVGDRWMRAQVCSAAGEAAMARGRFGEARGEYEEALRLAYEVGAYAESPFLMARLAEIAYRSGDTKTALAALDESGTAADRYAVPESRAFVLLMRAHIALHEGQIARAREQYEAMCAVTRGGNPPPQFVAAARAIEALLAADESGPAHGLPIVAEALREAVAQRCAESITAGLVDVAAGLQARRGDLAGAVRLFAAADHWRDGNPRPEPESSEALRVQADARAALPPERYAAERARGALLDVPGVLRELGAAQASAERSR
ncbi:BTAD domain-containing putative transcriptional regulator [Streptomyces fodineus]|uniref:BTAD domain-containing putative transcriptional regulator n=1 Tax=Streptomyces fodineus TaxID=1904616 RepID=UPI001D05BF0A|nr:BTAD domain-containing putative transcriptional regulator [Streptomyces fodineus]